MGYTISLHLLAVDKQLLHTLLHEVICFLTHLQKWIELLEVTLSSKEGLSFKVQPVCTYT